MTIDSGATMQWGAGNAAFLVGGGNAITDNGALVLDFGGGGVAGAVPISGTGTVEVQSGAFNESGVSTYTGTTTVDSAGFFALSAGGSISDSSNVIVNGAFDISGTTAGTSITRLNGSGQVNLGAQTLTLTGSGTFAGVIQDTGLFSGTGGALTIASGVETLTGTNTFTGDTTIDPGATLKLGNGSGTTGSVAGDIVDNGLLQFDYAGVGTANSSTITGSGSAEVVAGTAVVTAASVVGGTVTIDSGATMQWGAGNAAFLLGAGNSLVDNGALVMNFGGGGVAGAIPISGTGTVELQSGAFNDSGVSTYTGTTTIDAAGFFALSAGGSISDSSNVIDNGIFDISGETAGTSITTLSGSGQVSVGSQTLTLTAASGTFSGVIQDAGLFAGAGGGLTIAGGTETLTGTNTFTGPTTINTGATLVLGNGGTTGTVAGAIVDDGLVQFNYSGAVTAPNTFSGTGSAEVVAGTLVVTNGSVLGGTVTIDSGATMQWGAGGPAFLVGTGNGIIDNGALVMNFGGGGVGGAIPISGTGTVEIQSGALTESGVSTYTGATTIDAAGFLELSGGGGIADSSNVIDNGTFDISSTTAGASITTLTGSGGVSLGGQTLTLTAASGTFSGVLADGGISGGTGGGLTIAAGTETLTGTNTFTGATTIDTGATLQLGNGGATGSVAGPIVDDGLVQFNYSGAVTLPGAFSGTGSAEVVAGTLVVTNGGVLGGTVTIDNGATMQWGAGGPAFLLGNANSLVDNGALVLDFGGGGVGGSIPISGTGTLEIQSGSLNDSGTSTYTGTTTIDAAGLFLLSVGGSIADSSNVIANGTLDISGTTAGASITTLNGSGGVSLGGQTLTLTAASGAFSGVLADGGLSGGTGGGLTIAAGTETLTGTNTFTGATTIDTGATLKLGAGGATGTVAGAIVDDGLVQFDYSGAATIPGAFSGTGSVEVVAGTLIATNAGIVGGTVTIDSGATLQWGAGNPAFLIGGGGGVIDNGALVLNFGGGGVGGTIPISGSGTFVLQSGSLNNAGVSTYTGATTIDAAGFLLLNGAGSISDSSNVIDNGTFDISGTTAGTSIVTLSGSGGVSLGGLTLTLTNASGTFSGVLADGGFSGGTGGGLTIAAGTETLTGTNTFTGLTTIDLGATLKLVGAGSIADSGDPLVNGTFDISGASGGVSVISLSGSGHVLLGSNTLTLSDAADLFSGSISGAGGLTIGAGSETLTGTNSFTGKTTIDTGATLQLGNGGGAVGLAGAITDDGLLIFDGGAASHASLATSIIGTGSLTLETGTLGLTGTNTYTGATTIDPGATLALGNGTGTTGSVAGAIVDDGSLTFDYAGAVTSGNAISGTGSVELIAGTLAYTGVSGVGGSVSIDHGATMQWGDGAGGAFLIGGGNTVVDNGALVMDFGGGGVSGPIAISGAGSVTLESGSLSDSAASTYTGATTIDAAGDFILTGAGSISHSSNVIDNGTFDISGTTAGTSITTLAGSGAVSLGARTLTLTNASGTFSGALADGGASGGTGGGLTIAGGAETLTGTNTFTGLTTVNAGASLQLGAAGATGSVAGNIVDSGSLVFDRSNVLVYGGSISGAGAITQGGAGTTVLNGASPFTGVTTISSGVLEVGDASHGGAILGGNVIVGANGELIGHGRIVGSVTNTAGGTVAPGGTIGVLTVGSYTQAATWPSRSRRPRRPS